MVVCYRCGQQGHFAKECPNEEARCYRCGQKGHVAANCTEEEICYKCGEKGHLAKDCTKEEVEGNKYSRCYRCGELGHISSACPNMKCFKCGQIGHSARNCPNKEIATQDAKCFKCGNTGHLAKDCPSVLETRKCYKCGERGHLASQCPKVEPGLTDKAETQKTSLSGDRLATSGTKVVNFTSAVLTDGTTFGRLPLTVVAHLMQNIWTKRTLHALTRLSDRTSAASRSRAVMVTPTPSQLVKPHLKKRLGLMASLSTRIILAGLEKFQLLRRVKVLRLK